jgi:subtilisin family serine protease
MRLRPSLLPALLPALVTALLNTSCQPGEPTAQDTGADALGLRDTAPVGNHLVLLDLNALGLADAEPGSKRWSDAKAALVAALGPGVEVRHDYSHLPMLDLDISAPTALWRLRGLPGVLRVDADAQHAMSLAESLPLIHQPQAAAQGQLGAGTAVAVLDTGVDYTRPEFGACTAAGGAGCKVAYAQDFAPNDSTLDANGHGTNVAAIVLGVAPGTQVLALDVFNGSTASSSDIISAINWCIAHQATYHIAAMNLSLGSGSYTAACTDVFAAPLQAARTAGILPVVAAGNDGHANALSSPACAPAAVSVGAVYDANVNGLAYANCTDLTTAADQVACFSNAASFLTVWAPGALITAGGMTMAGTSQAAPHVAGALAVLRAAYPTDSTDQLVARITQSGVPLTDPRSGVTRPRLQLEAALATGTLPPVTCTTALSAATAVAAPLGGTSSVTVTQPAGCPWSASTAATWLTFSATSGQGTAALTLTAAANTGAARSATVSIGSKSLTVSQATACTPTLSAASVTEPALGGTGNVTVSAASICPWTATSSATWLTLSAASGQGPATVSLTAAVNTGAARSATVTLAGKSVTVTQATACTPTLSASSVSVLGSGGAGAVTVSVAAICPWTATTSASWVTLSAGSGQGNGSVTVTAAPNAGAARSAAVVLAGKTLTVSQGAEQHGPVGSLSINAGGAWTTSPTVSLHLSATDPSGVTQLCVSNTTTCMAWRAYAATLSWSLTLTNGPQTVTVWYKDTLGNISAAYVASIGLDNVAPTGGALTAQGATTHDAVDLSWSGFADATSGVVSYKAVMAVGAAPASCTAGTALYSGTAPQTRATGLHAGTGYGFRVCAVDAAGNVSAGVTATATP